MIGAMGFSFFLSFDFIFSYCTYIVSPWDSHAKRNVKSTFLHSKRSGDALSHRMIFTACMKICIKVFDGGVVRVGSLYLLLTRRCYAEASLASGVRQGNSFQVITSVARCRRILTTSW